MNIGCTSRGPTILVVCGDIFPFIVTLAFCVAVCAASILVCVCVLSVRGADTTDRSRRMCMRWSLVCRSCLLLPLPSVCVCVCLLPWIGVCVVRGVRRTVHAWLLLSPHVVCPLCVCLPHLSSPLLLSMSLTVQISSTRLNDHTHDDDVSSAVRPAGARPVLLPSVCSEEAKVENTTTTTTTKPPTTTTTNNKATNHDDHTTTKPPTTTTTTTTTAPEAPSITTTETPNTTTTRAPSSIRRIDGSLGSSAWACAPLLLAASALTYTTLG
ncbi:putative mucin TcMUCII [Trypanosoma cruzi]|uniref:Putative mucin TcMUCII n=1 Tax=Trypanosoma cruzi TaxID=5693 RepID=A0A2V2V202_TRYCR|nr:putative mucin TcMUCII [Trypanosoma cruzi]